MKGGDSEGRGEGMEGRGNGGERGWREEGREGMG